MSKHNAAPTHGWVISSRITKYLAIAFLVITFIVFVTVWTITWGIRRDCSDVYKRDLKVGGYWLYIQAGSNDTGCPESPAEPTQNDY
jgi:hypothetical protein